MANQGMAWSRMLSFLCVGVFLIVGSVASLQTSWRPPERSDLVVVRGRFVTLQKRTFQPYEFVTEAGDHILLGCIPGIRVVNCLSRISDTSALSGSVTIGYMKVNIPWWHFTRITWSNALLTVDADSKSILDYSASTVQIQHAYAFHQKSKWMVPLFILPFGGGFLLVFVAAVIQRIRRNH